MQNLMIDLLQGEYPNNIVKATETQLTIFLFPKYETLVKMQRYRQYITNLKRKIRCANLFHFSSNSLLSGST